MMLLASSSQWSTRRRTGIISLLLALMLMLSLLASQQHMTPAAQAQTWNLVWSDEFDGTSLNTSNWTYETGGGGWGNNERQYYTNGQNATVSGGVLTIQARRVTSGYSCWYGTCEWTSTRIKTQGKHQFTYGRLEARLALPLGAGVWPAFWMLGGNFATVGWPASGEIDIMEHINSDSTIFGTLHWDSNGYATYGGNTQVSGPTAYHVYAVEWTPSYIRWFIDGRQYHEANIAGGINSTDEFHRPFFFLLNLAVGGNWPGMWNGTTPTTLNYLVDYVRVYQQGDTTGVTFYKDSNYAGGASGVKGKGDYPNLPADVPNDWMSSLRVPAGWTVSAYEHGGFGGAVCTYTADTAWVGTACNDKMSSFKIR
jgi:beta-glucanase (GH16 family)